MIAQESLQAFINALSPGAYLSITKIDFKILDDLLLKPIGIYGSREEIVRFLREMGIIDVKMYVYPSLYCRTLTSNTSALGTARSATSLHIQGFRTHSEIGIVHNMLIQINYRSTNLCRVLARRYHLE
jgi:hypothetical protein